MAPVERCFFHLALLLADSYEAWVDDMSEFKARDSKEVVGHNLNNKVEEVAAVRTSYKVMLLIEYGGSYWRDTTACDCRGADINWSGNTVSVLVIVLVARKQVVQAGA